MITVISLILYYLLQGGLVNLKGNLSKIRCVCGKHACCVVLALLVSSIKQQVQQSIGPYTITQTSVSYHLFIRKHISDISIKMPSTPQMRKANEKNAKNVTKRGNVTKTSKTDEKYPVSPELIVSLSHNNVSRILPDFSIFRLSSYLS